MPETPEKPKHHDHSTKETAITLLISFAMALVFRSYVVEAFRIPTGSMAPTLLGENIPFRSDQTGYEWTVNPWFSQQGITAVAQQKVSVTDPMTTNNAAFSVDAPGMRRPPNAFGYITEPRDRRLRPGDRILVLKYIYALFEPTRYDVVVFKNPSDANQNYIKRLVGLPGEEVLIAAGDIFTRLTGSAADEWKIQRKPHHVQQRLWRPQYSSDFRPLAATTDVGPEPARVTYQSRSGQGASFLFAEPWLSREFQLLDHTAYRNDSGGVAQLRWNDQYWPITDRVPYNEAIPTVAAARYPVPDIRLRAGVRPDGDDLSLAARIRTMGHEFAVRIEGGGVRMTRRPLDVDVPDRVVAGTLTPLPAETVTNVAFCHVDQSLQLWINDRLVLEDRYDDWTPLRRLELATDLGADEILDREAVLLAPESYLTNLAEAEWEFTGAVTLYRVGLDRDIYYEPYRNGKTGRFGLATLPSNPAVLNGDQYFCLGDNSPASLDGRGWDAVDQSIAAAIDDTIGVVPRKLMIGKAFFVYFPGPHEFAGRTLIPDTGDMRIIH